jgi:hypothetical protein
MRPAFRRLRDRGEDPEQEDRKDGYPEYRSSKHLWNYKLPHSDTATEIPAGALRKGISPLAVRRCHTECRGDDRKGAMSAPA